MSVSSLPVSTDPAGTTPRGGVRTFLRNAWETAKVFLISLAIIVPLRAYIVQPFFVRGDSMASAFENGEYLVIDEASLTFGIRPPQRGDVVVFRYPLDPSQYFIKRIIGLGGETVRISGGAVSIESPSFPQTVVLDESSYLSTRERTDGETVITLRPNEYFVLGDNRDRSSDSRAWGPLSTDLIVGRAWMRVLPLSRAGFVATPWYGSLTAGPAETTRVTP